jgi:ubiquinone/menaquinone biosynthesis C-methylase UbiE
MQALSSGTRLERRLEQGSSSLEPGYTAGMPMAFAWPADFSRVPPDDWTRGPVETLARKYDTVENHGWYRNLEPTLDELVAGARDGDLIVDYSGGTGIFVDRALKRLGPRAIGFVIVDASPKFLRLALDKLGEDPRVAFRWIRFLKEAKRLEYLHEVLPLSADAIVSTNAIHLYYDLPGTLASWARVLKPGGRALVQSGNLRNPAAPSGWRIIDETVEAIHRKAKRIVREEARFAEYRPLLEDLPRLRKYGALRRKYFLPVRPLAHYVDALEAAGLRVESATARVVEAKVDEWFQFLAAYHEGVLGWIGGAEKIEGRAPSPEAVRDRLDIMREALRRIFRGRETFRAAWTYVTAVKEA